jgi:hypothetical protein
MIMMRSLVLSVAALCVCACATHHEVFRVGSTELLGNQFVLCKSQVKWDGININVEGLDVVPEQAASTKSFKVGKLGMSTEEVHKLDSMALLINGWFVDKCNSAVMLSHDPGLADFLKTTSVQTLKMMQLLAQMETISANSNDSAQIVKAQQEALNTTVAQVTADK